MNRPRSDALVLFGATGDLAGNMILPALCALAARGAFEIPLIAVARHDADAIRRAVASALDACATARRSLDRHLSRRIRYVAGDLRDASTYTKLKNALRDAKHPLYYLAIPPISFPSSSRDYRAQESPPVRASRWRNRSDTIALQRARSRRRSARHSRTPRYFVSITFSPRIRCAISCSSDSGTAGSTRRGIATPSRGSRSRWPKHSAFRVAVASMMQWARSAMCFRIICCKSSRC